jgi:hypothetical protein
MLSMYVTNLVLLLDDLDGCFAELDGLINGVLVVAKMLRCPI